MSPARSASAGAGDTADRIEDRVRRSDCHGINRDEAAEGITTGAGSGFAGDGSSAGAAWW